MLYDCCYDLGFWHKNVNFFVKFFSRAKSQNCPAKRDKSVNHSMIVLLKIKRTFFKKQKKIFFYDIHIVLKKQ